MTTTFNNDKTVICSTCRIQFSTILDYKLHISTEYHVYNTKRRIAQLDPISELLFDQKRATLALQSQCQSQVSEMIWKCQPCKKVFKSNEQMEQHKNTKNHKRSEKEWRLANPETTLSSIFQNISTDKPLLTQLNLHPEPQSPTAKQDPTQEHDEQQEKSEESKLPSKTALDSLRVCIFCNQELSGVKKCLDHMRLQHSFFILDVDCVINLKGLLTYIAERVHLGYMCLFCSRMFKNARRCQQHMMDKAHCFMSVEDEQEYEQFYDFSKTYEDHPDAIPRVELKGKGEEKEEQEE